MALIQSMILGAFFEPQDILAEDPPEAAVDTDVTVLAATAAAAAAAAAAESRASCSRVSASVITLENSWAAPSRVRMSYNVKASCNLAILQPICFLVLGSSR